MTPQTKKACCFFCMLKPEAYNFLGNIVSNTRISLNIPLYWPAIYSVLVELVATSNPYYPVSIHACISWYSSILQSIPKLLEFIITGCNKIIQVVITNNRVMLFHGCRGVLYINDTMSIWIPSYNKIWWCLRCPYINDHYFLYVFTNRD